MDCANLLFKERDLSSFKPLAIFLDTIHRGKDAFVVAMGASSFGQKMALGFWQGATENSEICKELLNDLEKRGCHLGNRVIWVTDGGSGIIKCLKERYGKKLLHQRCILHKLRNILGHLSEKYRKEAKDRYDKAMGQIEYQESKNMLQAMERWPKKINCSAANSLKEAMEEILLLHKLGASPALRKSLRTTNPIESMF